MNEHAYFLSDNSYGGRMNPLFPISSIGLGAPIPLPDVSVPKQEPPLSSEQSSLSHQPAAVSVEVPPLVLPLLFEAQRELVLQFLKKAKWDQSKFYPLTIRQVLFCQLQLLIQELKSQSDTDEEMNLATIQSERDCVVEIGILAKCCTYLKPGCVLPLEPRALQAIEKLKARYPTKFPFLRVLRELFCYKDFLNQPIATIAKQPLDPYIPKKTFRKLLIAYQWLTTMAFPIENLRSRGEILEDCYEMCINSIRLSGDSEKKLEEVMRSWDAYAAGRNLAAEIEYRYRLTLNEAIDDLEQNIPAWSLRTIKEKICESIAVYAEASQQGYSRELQVIERFLEAMPSEAAYRGTYGKKISPVQLEVDIVRLNFCRRQLESIKAFIVFGKGVEQFSFDAFRQDLASLRFPQKPDGIDSYAEADSSELLELLTRGVIQKTICASPPSPTTQSRKYKKKEATSSAPSLEVPALVHRVPVKESSMSALSCFLDTVESACSREDAPRKITHFSVIHKNIFEGFFDKAEPSNMSQIIRYRMRELSNHLFLSSCGFELMSKLIQKNRLELLSAVFPCWILDRYLMVELHGDVQSLLQGYGVPERHSLHQTIDFISQRGPCPKKLREYIKGLSNGIFWYRYFVSYRNDTFSQSSQEFMWLQTCHELAQETKRVDPKLKTEIVDFIQDRQASSLQLLYQTLSSYCGYESMPQIGERVGAYLLEWKNAFLQAQDSSSSDCRDGIFQPEIDRFSHLIEHARRACFSLTDQPDMVVHRSILEEILLHLHSLKNVLEVASLCSEPHLLGFLMRNVLNVQWLREHMYLLECNLLHLSVSRTHNFRVYEEALRASGRRISRELPEFLEFNCGIALHYEELYQRPTPPFASYRQILEQNFKEATYEEGYTTVGAATHDSRGSFVEHVRRVSALIETALVPLLDRCMSS